jgi:hypothetical protein
MRGDLFDKIATLTGKREGNTESPHAANHQSFLCLPKIGLDLGSQGCPHQVGHAGQQKHENLQKFAFYCTV